MGTDQAWSQAARVYLELEKELATLIQMKVFALIRTTHKHDAQLLLVHQLVAHGWVERALVVLAPLLNIVPGLHLDRLGSTQALMIAFVTLCV